MRSLMNSSSPRSTGAGSTRVPWIGRFGARPPQVALVVDHPARDLGGLVLTATELCRQGITCHLVPLNLMRDQLWTLAPDLVVLNYARPGHARLARDLIDAGIRVGILDTEGAAWETAEAYSELLWTDRTLFRRLSFVCMWGPVLARHLEDLGLVTDGQLAVTGCPRFDFYHPSWRRAFDDGPATDRPVLLINTNFSYSNPRFASVARNREHLQQELGLSGDRLEAYCAAEQSAMRGMIELARSLAGDFPACDVVLRPHPFESHAPYVGALGKTAGVTIDGDGPVQPRLFAARAVIQRSCSTAAEAAMAGVPTLSPQWLPAPAVVGFAEAVSIPCTSYAQLRERVGAIVGGSDGEGLAATGARGCLADWFGPLDGQAHRRVAETILQHLPATRTVDARRCLAQLYRLDEPGHSRGQRLAARIRYRLRLSPAWAFRHWRVADGREWLRSDKAFGAADVAALAQRIARAADAGQLHTTIRPAPGTNPHGASIPSHSVTLEPGA
jgi:surface carbohydrate biosynthesis protein